MNKKFLILFFLPKILLSVDVSFYNYSFAPVDIVKKSEVPKIPFRTVPAGKMSDPSVISFEIDNLDEINIFNQSINSFSKGLLPVRINYDLSKEIGEFGYKQIISEGLREEEDHLPQKTKFSFLALSDEHCDIDGSTTYIGMQAKTNLIPEIKKYILDPQKNVKAFLIPGDEVQSGANQMPWDSNYRAEGGFNVFLKNWYTPLIDELYKVGAKLYLGIGNHDYDGRAGFADTYIVEFINKLYGDIYYSFDINGVHFINLGLYPSEGSLDERSRSLFKTHKPAAGGLEWLEEHLKKVDKKIPLILFFHYPMTGSQSNWTKKSEKDKFFELIKDYNVKALIVGHVHKLRNQLWRGIWHINVSSSKGFLWCSFDPNSEKLEAWFVDKNGKKKALEKPTEETEEKNKPEEGESATLISNKKETEEKPTEKTEEKNKPEKEESATLISNKN